MVALGRARELGSREHGLAVAVVVDAKGTPVLSVVNAGVLDHPFSGEPVVGFVARGQARKLTHLRERPRATVLFRSGWEWVAVEGDVELVGPRDAADGVEPDDLPRLLRTVYAAAVGGTEDQWAELDALMAAEGHTAVLIRPHRVYGSAE